jgi:hypothetical protein
VDFYFSESGVVIAEVVSQVYFLVSLPILLVLSQIIVLGLARNLASIQVDGIIVLILVTLEYFALFLIASRRRKAMSNLHVEEVSAFHGLEVIPWGEIDMLRRWWWIFFRLFARQRLYTFVVGSADSNRLLAIRSEFGTPGTGVKQIMGVLDIRRFLLGCYVIIALTFIVPTVVSFATGQGSLIDVEGTMVVMLVLLYAAIGIYRYKPKSK